MKLEEKLLYFILYNNNRRYSSGMEVKRSLRVFILRTPIKALTLYNLKQYYYLTKDDVINISYITE